MLSEIQVIFKIGDSWYISNAGCKTQPFLQLYSTISKLGFKETKTSRYLHLPCINMKKSQLFFCRPDDVSVSCRSTAMAGTYACHDVCVAVDNHGPHGILCCNSLSYLLLTGNYPLVPSRRGAMSMSVCSNTEAKKISRRSRPKHCS